MKYEVKIYKQITETYYVEAADEDEATTKVLGGEYEGEGADSEYIDWDVDEIDDEEYEDNCC